MAKQYYLPNGFAALRYRFGGNALGDEASFTLHVSVAATTAASLRATAQTAFFDTVLISAASFSSSYNWRGVDVSLSQPTGDPIIAEGDQNISGASASPVVPPNCAMLITKNTGLGGRRNRGRVYCPAFALNEDQVGDSGTIVPATVAAWNTRWFNLFEAMETAGHPFQVAHQYDPALLEEPVLPTSMISFTVQDRIATQRRRLR